MATKPFRCGWIGTILVVLCISTWAIAGSSSDPLQLSLSKAITLTLEHHSDVHQAELALQLARLEWDAARARAMLPWVEFQIKPPNLTLDGLSGKLQGTLAMGLSLPWGADSQLSANLGLTWESLTDGWQSSNWAILFSQRLDFLRLDAGSEELEAKRQAVQDRQAALEKTRNGVVLESVEVYSDLLTEAARLDQATSDLEQAQAALKEVEALVAEGLKGEASLLEARLGVLNAQIALDERRSSYRAQQKSFARVVLRIDTKVELVPFEVPVERLNTAAGELLPQEGLVTTAILGAPEVRAAQRRVEEATETLRAGRLALLPDLRVEAGLDQQGLRVGLTIAFDLFSPDRRQVQEMAQINLALAEAQLEAAREKVRDRILNQQVALRQAITNLDRLALEKEKWTLEEKVKQAKFEAGLLSEEDWEEFLEEKRAFDLSKDQRSSSLLLAYLGYRDTLGLELNWEEWLK